MSLRDALSSLKRAFQGNDTRAWRVPGLLYLRWWGDYGARAAYSLGIGLGIASPVSLLVILAAPPGQSLAGIGIATLFVVTVAALVFLSRDLSEELVTLEDDAIRREVRPFLLNPIGRRDRVDRWPYAELRACGLVPAEQLGVKFSLLVVSTAGGDESLIVPHNVAPREVAAWLFSRGVRVEMLKEVPTSARPVARVTPRGNRIATMLAALGLVCALGGLVARPFVHGTGRKLDPRAVAAALQAAPEVRPAREWTVPGGAGVVQAALSDDGQWLWTETTKSEGLLWSVRQPEPVGKTSLPAAAKRRVLFAADARFIVVADRDVTVWQRESLQAGQQFTLEEVPDHVTLDRQGRDLLVTTMTQVRAYALETGQPRPPIAVPLGAVIDAAPTVDGKELFIVQQPRIVRVRLDERRAEEWLVYGRKNPVYLFGSIAANGRWAALVGAAGTDVYDLTGRKLSQSLGSGPMHAVPQISPDGRRLIHAALEGIGIWDVASRRAIGRGRFVTSTDLAFCGDGSRFVAFSRRSPRVALWDVPP